MQIRIQALREQDYDAVNYSHIYNGGIRGIFKGKGRKMKNERKIYI
jgi:hypothetical protein